MLQLLLSTFNKTHRSPFCTGKIAVLTRHLVPPISVSHMNFWKWSNPAFSTDYLALFRSGPNPTIAVPTPRWQRNCGTKVTSAKAKRHSLGFQRCLLFRSQANTMSYSIGQEYWHLCAKPKYPNFLFRTKRWPETKIVMCEKEKWLFWTSD